MRPLDADEDSEEEEKDGGGWVGEEEGDYAGFPDLVAAEPDEEERGEEEGEGEDGEVRDGGSERGEGVRSAAASLPLRRSSSSSGHGGLASSPTTSSASSTRSAQSRPPSSSSASPSRSSSSSTSAHAPVVARLRVESDVEAADRRLLLSPPQSPSSAALVAGESDSSGDEGETGQELRYKNRVGRVPMEWYRQSAHIGYSVKGERLQRSAEGGDAIDRFLDRLASPSSSSAHRSVYDEVNDEWVELSEEELRQLQRVRHGSYAHLAFDPYADYDGGAFTADVRHEALGNAQEPKRRFIPSKWEAAKVVQLVRAMRNGWMRSTEESEEERRKKREQQQAAFLLWGEDGALLQEGAGVEEQKTGLHRMPPAIPPPKLALPGHTHSYNPPVEYLLSAEEEAAWRLQDAADRALDFLPRRYPSMRLIPAYEGAVKERFERALDLFLCPRQRRRKLRIDPDSLIPALPKPADLRPFPTRLAIAFTGHTAAVRSLAVHPRGEWLLSGAEDGTARLWELSTGRCFRTWTFQQHGDDHAHAGDAVRSRAVVSHVAFCPNVSRPLVSVCVGHCIMLLRTGLGSEEEESAMDALVTRQSADEREEEEERKRAVDEGEEADSGDVKAKRPLAVWLSRKERGGRIRGGYSLQPAQRPIGGSEEDDAASSPPGAVAAADVSSASSTASSAAAVLCDDDVGRAVLVVELGSEVLHLAWHAGGDYLSTTQRMSSSSSQVLLHRLSTHRSLCPFTRQRGAVQSSAFHPLQPFFFLATLQSVSVYHLTRQTLVKRLLTPAHAISSIALHPSGDHLLLSSLDRKVCWFDLDLSNRPYRTLKYHAAAVRQVAFHPSFPLFASVSDDGQLHLFHQTVYTDLLTNALIVPVKIIAAHPQQRATTVAFHPTQPFAVTASSSGAIHLFV